jgi:hypothetical protein
MITNEKTLFNNKFVLIKKKNKEAYSCNKLRKEHCCNNAICIIKDSKGEYTHDYDLCPEEKTKYQRKPKYKLGLGIFICIGFYDIAITLGGV